MNLVIDKVYKDMGTGKKIRVLEVNPDANFAICVRMECQSAKPRLHTLSDLNDQVSTRRLIPVELPVDEIPDASLSEAAKRQGEIIKNALAPLVEFGPLELSRRKLWKDFGEIGRQIGMTPAGVNTAFTKVLQAGMRLSAAVPRWHKCGRLTFVVEGNKLRAKPTNQPNSYPLSIKDIVNIKRGVEMFLVRERTWDEAHHEFLKKFYPATIKVESGKEIVEPLPILQRPSLSQFTRHGRRQVGKLKLLISRVGKEGFAANHQGKPIGQAVTALMPGMEADIDWTTSGLVSVRRANRLSIGTLVVYVIVDRFSGIILSMYLTLANASYEQAARAVLLCLEDKVELCRRYGIEIQPEDWDVHHLMANLTGDRGELNSWKSSSLVTGLGIGMKMTRTRMGKDKGSVESVNAWIKRLLRRLSGGVWKYRDRATESPQVEAIFDFDQVYRILLAFTIRYNKRLRRRQPMTQGMVEANLHLQPTPNKIWAHAARHGMLREMDLDHARIHVLPFRKASVTEYGIELDGLRFRVPDFNPDQPGGIAANEWLALARKKRWSVELGIDSATVAYVWLRHAPKGIAPMLLRCELAPGQDAYSCLSWAEYDQLKTEQNSTTKDYKETKLRDANSVCAAIIDDTIKEAHETTKAARANLPRAKMMNGIAENRSAEALEQANAARTPTENMPIEAFAPYLPKLPSSGT